MNVLPGLPHPLGATWDGYGVNFALYSENASRIELCLFDEGGAERRVALTNRTAAVWHGYVPGMRPGQHYAYRVHGPYEPERGLRFNPNVLLLDPYARALSRTERWELGCFGFDTSSPRADLARSEQAAVGTPRSVVVDGKFEWNGDAPPRIPLGRSVVYEAHVRGLTLRHPEVPLELRGTYSGVAHPAVIRHLSSLGITAIELMPVHGFVQDKHLLDRGLTNYWGYNSIAFFAPDVRYRSSARPGSEVSEFKSMVKALHAAGIEVILDVVYNHTAEGNHLGPTFSFKGIDNPVYYRLSQANPRYYVDYTGTGNTLNVRHPQVLALIMDSLRYWVEEMHVDGFRFDLAAALARQLHEVDQLSSFFTLIHDSPVLREVKMIAEPWDVGEGGYQVGNFPARWAEWNGRYRDTVRAFWRGDAGRLGDLGYRLTGSSDLYASSGRTPSASINFITAHDGFTLNDLVSYSTKHNEANGEDNRDGSVDEHSQNCGVEGTTGDPSIRAKRARLQRSMLATLVLSQGTPMLLGGDEFGRTQLGNNNPYCQDNEISWVNWDWNDENRELLEFTRYLLAIRRQHPGLRRSKYLEGRAIEYTDVRDLGWYRLDGQPMASGDWSQSEARSLLMFLAGRGIDEVDEFGRPIIDDDLAIVLNGSSDELPLVMPDVGSASEWELLLDTSGIESRGVYLRNRGESRIPANSLKLYRAPSRALRRGSALRTLGATYRLQVNAAFDFGCVAAQIEYLHELGVTDLYLSPIFMAASGSTHGYDVVSHQQLNPELGTEEDLRDLNRRLGELQMGLLLDWVPNHMGNNPGQNSWWDDVLENGPSSMFAGAFDIDWRPLKEELTDTILLPVLGDQFGSVLERGELSVVMEDGRFYVRYLESRFPLGPKTLVDLLGDAAANSELKEEDHLQQELESVCASLRHMPDRHATSIQDRRERAREKEVFKRRLRQLLESSPQIRRACERAVERVNGRIGDSQSFDALERLLADQSFRLASWRVAAQEINYRRFFDINSLVALRMEEQWVFEQAHRLLFRFIQERVIHALRLDHTDGLCDPEGYFENLQRLARALAPREQDTSPDDAARPLSILIEKIRGPNERLPSAWLVDGTTGYEFAAFTIGLTVDASAEAQLTEIYHRFVGDEFTFAMHVYDSKLRILRDSLASEVYMLARRLERIASSKRHWRDFTLVSLTRALVEVLAAFPVYRTYVRPASSPTEDDTHLVRVAVRLARLRTAQEVDASVFDFIQGMLLLTHATNEQERRDHEQFALRLQQLTGPVMAKSVEDTAFYRYHRLIALNEVGGDPGVFGTSVERFHDQCLERLRSWPLSMVTTSTHDTKRGEDAAAAIAVLSEMPEKWAQAVRRFSEMLEVCKNQGKDGPVPSRRDEYLFYQALVGAWPFGWNGKEGIDDFTERMQGYMRKATKEAKLETSWVNPNEDYDEGIARFVRSALGYRGFIESLRELCSEVGPYAACNSLTRTLLRFTVPGVPDTYQGAELWHQTLVDPDNRRAVDFEQRRRLLDEIRQVHERGPLIQRLLESWHTGAVKLFVTNVALQMRKSLPQVFLHGNYVALGDHPHLVAFSRKDRAHQIVVCAPRLALRLTQGRSQWPVGVVWGDSRVSAPPGEYWEAFTERRIRVATDLSLAECFAEFPLAVLVRQL